MGQGSKKINRHFIPCLLNSLPELAPVKGLHILAMPVGDSFEWWLLENWDDASKWILLGRVGIYYAGILP
jgi:hypothetical protein